MSVSWLVVRGAEKAIVLDTLGLAETGQRDELPAESPVAGAELDDDRYVVVFDRYGHEMVNDDTLHRVSQLGEVVAGAAEEHVMCCFACGWQRGQRMWRVVHDAQRGIDHLEVEGAMPPGFDEIRNELLDQQRTVGSAPDVDYLYDIPLETAKVVSAFHTATSQPMDSPFSPPSAPMRTKATDGSECLR
jgi:hypothetical protein